MSVADELQKLGALRDSGVLTDAEFQQQKAKLLGTEGPAESPQPATVPKKGGAYFPVMGIAMAVLLGVFVIVLALSG